MSIKSNEVIIRGLWEQIKSYLGECDCETQEELHYKIKHDLDITPYD